MTTQSIRSTFDHEFDQIRQSLHQMSGLIDNAISSALKALDEQNAKLAKKIIESDEHINQRRFEIQEACLALIATQQPAAGDLREIVAILYMVVELERIGDYAAGIAKTVVMMKEEPLLKLFKKIPRMGAIARQMLADVMVAFSKRDSAAARVIADRDNVVDNLYDDVIQRLIKIMVKEPEMVTRCTYLSWCAHNLERIADRVTNISEQIIFMTTGQMGEVDA
jgi:phosphate transport system protein